MKFKKLFISISAITSMSTALSFVSCNGNVGNVGENIFTSVKTDQKIVKTKTKIEAVIK